MKNAFLSFVFLVAIFSSAKSFAGNEVQCSGVHPVAGNISVRVPFGSTKVDLGNGAYRVDYVRESLASDSLTYGINVWIFKYSRVDFSDEFNMVLSASDYVDTSRSASSEIVVLGGLPKGKLKLRTGLPNFSLSCEIVKVP